MKTVLRAWCWVLVLVLVLVLGAGACGPAEAPTVTILHFNDVYEIDAVEGGHSGGLARVATVLDQLKKTADPVITTLGGDYLAPSAIGTAKVNGVALAGRQMVDVLNAVGVDWATFGNHEFDVTEADFRARLTESKFRLVSSNVTDVAGAPFPGTVTSAVVPVVARGRAIKLGLIGLTIDSNPKPWVKYLPAVQSARAEVSKLKGQVDAIIALTHLSLAGDQALVDGVPDIDLVLGGHEHENWFIRRGEHFTPIIKADADVRSIAIVTLSFGASGSRPLVTSRLEEIDDRLTAKPDVEAKVRQWTTSAFDAFKKSGFNPEEVVANVPVALDGRASTVRDEPGLLTDIIAAGLIRETKADVALLNGGSIRVDDVLPPGPLRQYDVIRVLPFGGHVLKASVTGTLLKDVLDIGVKNAGTGGYLQTAGISRSPAGAWLVKDQAISPSARYTVAMIDFLLTGLETNLGFLTRTNPQVRDVQEFRDVRLAMIDELKARYGK